MVKFEVVQSEDKHIEKDITLKAKLEIDWRGDLNFRINGRIILFIRHDGLVKRNPHETIEGLQYDDFDPRFVKMGQ